MMKKLLLCLLLCGASVYGAEHQGAEQIVDQEESMTIKIKTIKEEIPISCHPSTAIAAVKRAIFDTEGIPVNQQKLVKPASLKWLGTAQPVTLQDDKTCADYNLQDGSTVQLYLTCDQ